MSKQPLKSNSPSLDDIKDDEEILDDTTLLYKSMFNLMFDVDRSGAVDRFEFIEACEEFKLNLNNQEFNEIMDTADVNNDGNMDFDEFVQLLNQSKVESNLENRVAQGQLANEEEISIVFKIACNENEDFVGITGLKRLLETLIGFQLEQDIVQAYFDKYDPKKTGKLHIKEFTQLIKDAMIDYHSANNT